MNDCEISAQRVEKLGKLVEYPSEQDADFQYVRPESKPKEKAKAPINVGQQYALSSGSGPAQEAGKGGGYTETLSYFNRRVEKIRFLQRMIEDGRSIVMSPTD